MTSSRLPKLSLLALLACTAGCPSCPNPGADVVCDVNGCISLTTFSQQIANNLNADGGVVGFVSRVGDLTPAFSGFAETATDAPPNGQGMLPNLTTNVASVTKVITTVAAIQVLRAHNISLDAQVAPYIWSTWTVDPSLRGLTFRQLLQHRSGFRNSNTDGCPNGPNGKPTSCNQHFYGCGGDATTYGDLASVLDGGVDPANVGKPDYDNCNFALFREMLPFMAGQTYTGAANDTARAAWSDAFYINYVNQNVFAPLGIGPFDCQPPPSPGTQIVLAYPNPAGNTPGWNMDGSNWELACGGGGWQLSEYDLHVVANALGTTSPLLSDSDRDMMNGVQDGGFLGWDNTVRGDCPGPYPCKNGSLPNNGAEIWTYMGLFKCGTPVTVVVNSPLPAPYEAGNDIIGVVATAYQAAQVNQPARCCDGSAACNGQCCGLTNPVCCGGTCCGASNCINGSCCAPSQVCGTQCCANGQFCDNGSCVSSCPEGTDVSVSPTGVTLCCPLYQCDNPDGVCTEAACTNGCCGQGQLCCPQATPGYACDNAPCPVVTQ